MTDVLEAEPVVVTKSAHLGPEPVHEVCCKDYDTALCGTDVTGHEFMSPRVQTTCVVCDDLQQFVDAVHVCPLNGMPCPR